MQFKIAKGAAILLGCKFSCTHHFILGEHSIINQNCYIDNRGGIEISSNVSIGPKCNFITADHLMSSSSFEGRNRTILINEYAFLGFGATILGGVTIGVGSVIGALSLVLKDAEPFGIYVGQPAIKRNDRSKNLKYILNYRRLFH